MSIWVFDFDKKIKSGRVPLKNLLGGKGANLSEMIRIGLPVPPGFTISTEACNEFYKSNQKYPKNLEKQVKTSIKNIEKKLKKNFGNKKNPLLVSVRSGARVSMPGMMDTVLNLGLNDETVQGLYKKTNNEKFAYDSYRRFIQMYSNVVLGVDHHNFEDLIEKYKLTKGVVLDTDLEASDWKELILNFREVIKEQTKKEFPQNVFEQLWGAIGAVFLSW